MAHSLEATKAYLDYLDKEMTIQGVLSAFCVAASALLLQKVLLVGVSKVADIGAQLSSAQAEYFLCAIATLLIAALLFYLERSNLTLLMGEFSLALAREERDMETPEDSYSVSDSFAEADSWMLWFYYRAAFWVLSASAVEVILAVLAAVWPQSWIAGHPWFCIVPTALSAIRILWLWIDLRRKDSLSDSEA